MGRFLIFIIFLSAGVARSAPADTIYEQEVILNKGFSFVLHRIFSLKNDFFTQIEIENSSQRCAKERILRMEYHNKCAVVFFKSYQRIYDGAWVFSLEPANTSSCAVRIWASMTVKPVSLYSSKVNLAFKADDPLAVELAENLFRKFLNLVVEK